MTPFIGAPASSRLTAQGGAAAAGALLAGVLLASGFIAAPLAAQQPLAARVAAVGNGIAQFEFPSRPDACGDGLSYVRIGNSMNGSFDSRTPVRSCEPGPVRIVLELKDGAVTALRDYLGPVPPMQAGVTELGEVPASEGSSYLLGLVESQPEGHVVHRAVFPAMLGRDVVAWPTLLRIAKASGGGRRGTRHEVVFWLAQYAAAKLAGSDDPFAARDRDDVGDDDGVKAQAVFALSQLHNGEGIDPLLQVARTSKDQRLRAKAMFWLGESGDPRALDLFEQVLTGHVPAPQG
jgi:hypothetical protein